MVRLLCASLFFFFFSISVFISLSLGGILVFKCVSCIYADIQGIISKMNPQVVKSVIANGCLEGNKQVQPSACVPSTPKETQTLSVCDPTLRFVE